MKSFLEIWTTHLDYTCTLVRENCVNRPLALLRMTYIQSLMERDHLGWTNDFGERVEIEITEHAPGQARSGTFHFAD